MKNRAFVLISIFKILKLNMGEMTHHPSILKQAIYRLTNYRYVGSLYARYNTRFYIGRINR